MQPLRILSHRPGLTLIELVIAVTVAVALLSVAIPQFNDLNRRQELYYDTEQKIVLCIQKAQQAAMASTETVQVGGLNVPVRWTAAEIGTKSCSVQYFGGVSWDNLAGFPNGTTISTDTFDTNGPYVNSIGVVFGGSTTGQSLPTRIYFDALDKGRPARVVSSISVVPSTSGSVFTTNINVRSGDAGNAVSALVTVNPLGAPIKLEKN